jgi:hypothetical protein
MVGTIPGSSPGIWEGHDDGAMIIVGESELRAAGMMRHNPKQRRYYVPEVL